MPGEEAAPVPTGISLHQRTRIVEVAFGDGATFQLPAEYLRVFDPAAVTRGDLIRGKEGVGISRIMPEGNHAIRPVFTDGYDGAVYDWATLYVLGSRQQENWEAYLRRLEAAGHPRPEPEGGMRVSVLYFARLVDRLGRDSEELRLPPEVTTIGSLLDWLRARGGNWETYLAEGSVQATVNRDFAKPDTAFRDGDEIAIVPTHPG